MLQEFGARSKSKVAQYDGHRALQRYSLVTPPSLTHQGVHKRPTAHEIRTFRGGVKICLSSVAVTVSQNYLLAAEPIAYTVGYLAIPFTCTEPESMFPRPCTTNEKAVELHPSRSAILEMRPVHTPLEEMAREEMSELDLEYPW